MGLFDSLQNLTGGLIGGASDAAQGSISDAVGGLTDNATVQGLQDQATTITDSVGDAVTAATEQGKTVVDDISQNLGL